MSIVHQKIYQSFCDNTKITFYLVSTAIVFMWLGIIGPYSTNYTVQWLFRIIVITLLSYSMYIMLISSNSLLRIDNMFTNSNLANIRNNYILHIAYLFVIFLAILYLLYGFFY